MQKYKKIILISSGILCMLGIVIMAFAMMTVNFDVNALDLCGEPQKVSKAYTENIKSVSIDLINSDVVIKHSKDERIWVTYYTTDCCPTVSAVSQDGTLNVSDNYNDFVYNIKQYTKGFFHGYRKNDLETVIEIPSDSKNLDIHINTSNGKIRIENISAKNIDVETSNGKVQTENISAESITLNTSNGVIDVSDISVSKYAVLNTSNGDITAKNITAETDIDIDTSNGKIILYNINTDTITAGTSNGRIESSLVNSDAAELITSNGNITVSDLKAKSHIYIETSNGSIEGSITGSPEDYYISSGTSNGNDSLAIYNDKNKESENKLYAYTSNGNILINFDE